MSEPTTSGPEKSPEQKTSAQLGTILVIIPTYNEAENIEPIIARVRESVPAAHILVTDDNSPDGTGAIADRLAAADDDQAGRNQRSDQHPAPRSRL